jgi:hypothetical protein
MRRECGIPGVTASPSTVTAQSGVLEKVVAWVADSWRDIQIRHNNWRWMRSGFTVNTVVDDDAYAYGDCTDTRSGSAIDRFRQWWMHDRLDPPKCYLTSGGVAGEYRLIWMPPEDFRRIYKFGIQQSTNGQPIHITVDDDNKFLLGPKPNSVYTVSGRFQRGAQTLDDDSDVPDMPADFHDLIVYYGMERYAFNSVAPEVLSRAKLEASRLMRALEQDQLPPIRLGRALA